MDYYEELGLQRTASPEEIREAYHSLARLLHPEPALHDARTRALARIQMRRLNELYAVLADPERRRRYDGRPALEGCGTRAGERGASGGRRVGLLGSLVWLAAAAAGIAGLAWYLTPPKADGQAIRLPAGVPPAVPAFAGAWVPPGDETAEAVIAEQDGWLQGHYRTLRQAAGGSVPREVFLRFEGRPEGNQARLPWVDGGESVGEVRLTLLPDGSLKLAWMAAGAEDGLPASGSAVLVRRAP